ncbi:ethanolamine utilization protein EutJ [Pueribacillus theae]|uniref:Ethanolamine utilization protein EutJ n=1 Tax=Pueribacillus theae TaxID=2171751 RepID=A0A2U1K5I1_9BACI|nr:ABC transporter substrate-binding protein [Pueribacillus theae]PWA12767.1 ethanolamine utilization protein EutJ [Pueribacillus theae]
MISKKSLFVSFILLLMLALAACSGSSSSSSDSGKNSESASKGSSGDVKEVPIGYSGPLSGAAAYYGENTVNGLKMAAEEINEAGGFEVDGQKYKLKLVTLDDKYLPNETASNAKRLIQENDAKVIFNPHSGGIKAMQVFNEQEEFLIAAYTSEPDIIEQGNELTWRIPPGYDTYIEPFSDYEMERFGKKIAFLPTASQYGKDWAENLKPVWEKKGGEVVFEADIDFSKDTDFYTVVTNALKEKPDVLFIGGPSEPTALVAKQARDLGFEGGFLIMDQAKMDEMAAVMDGKMELLEGSVGVLPLVNTDYPGTAAFVEKYREAHKKDPGSEAGLNYIALYALVEAMKVAGTVDDAAAIRKALDEGVKNIPEDKQVYQISGVTEKGANELPLRMGVVEDGEVKQVDPEKK